MYNKAKFQILNKIYSNNKFEYMRCLVESGNAVHPSVDVQRAIKCKPNKVLSQLKIELKRINICMSSFLISTVIMINTIAAVVVSHSHAIEFFSSILTKISQEAFLVAIIFPPEVEIQSEPGVSEVGLSQEIAFKI